VLAGLALTASVLLAGAVTIGPTIHEVGATVLVALAMLILYGIIIVVLRQANAERRSGRILAKVLVDGAASAFLVWALTQSPSMTRFLAVFCVSYAVCIVMCTSGRSERMLKGLGFVTGTLAVALVVWV